MMNKKKGMTEREKEYLYMIEAGIPPGRQGFKMIFKAAREGRLEFDDTTPRLKRNSERTKKFVESHRISKNKTGNVKSN